MMSKFKSRLYAICSLLLVVAMAMPMLAGCGGKRDSGPDDANGPEAQCTVTFDKNTSHETNTLQPVTVDNGKTVKAPTVIVTDTDESNRYTVVGWYTSKDCKEDEKWNFANPVTKSMTLYAAWQEKVKVEFYLGGTATAPSSVQWVVKGERAEREDGLVGFYKLQGYFTDEDCMNEFSFDTALTADQKLYIKYDATAAYLNAVRLSAFGFGLVDAGLDDSTEAHRPSVTKCTEEPEEGEAFDYARYDFGDLSQPYVWDPSVNLDIKGKNMLEITYRNVGKANKINFYYVMGYVHPGSPMTYSNGGGFGPKAYVSIDIEAPDDEWHVATVDMGANTYFAASAGISEWGSADMLCFFRIDYPHGVNSADMQEGDAVLEVKEVKFYPSDPPIDYSAKDSDELKGKLEACDTTAPAEGDWDWSVETGAALYYREEAPLAFFPYGKNVSKLTATAKAGNTVDCDADDKKALFIGYDNLGYGTSAKIGWTAAKEDGTQVFGEKSVSLDARKEGIVYVNLAEEENWTGTLQSLTIDYVNKGVDNAIVIKSVEIATPEAADIPGISFESGPMGFADDAWSVTDKTLTVGVSGVTKTAADGKTVLDVDNAVVYKGFTVWYTGASDGAKLTLTYTDEADAEHSATVDLSHADGEHSAVFAFVDEESGRSVMRGKIKALKLHTDKGSIAVRKIDYNFDVHDTWYNTSVEGITDWMGQGVLDEATYGEAAAAIFNAAASTNIGKSMTYNVPASHIGTRFFYEENKNAYACSFTDTSSRVNTQLSALSNNTGYEHKLETSVLSDKKLYIVLNNDTASTRIRITLKAGTETTAATAVSADLDVAVPANMGNNSWVVAEITIPDNIATEDYIGDLQIQANAAGNVYFRAFVFR